ncbi:DNA gyrase subunit A [Cuniculiplasma sp. SKW4]|uniref:DNA gyrase subunit A n=1 Tax=Cuniculiplasma sp. SKW4 TaxID=3400171 RepID=UPI003FD09FA9
MESRPIENEIKKSYLEYAMSVIVSRAIPDVRDGLKPVQRRILYSMYENGFTRDKPYKKSARIVGEAMGKYHPHGDSAIYDAMARMAQEFSLRYPLIDGQGNFGSIDGDAPAAMRYTEARMNSISESMLIDIDKNTVPFMMNFDGTLQEPVYLPSSIPNLLINGGSGIAVGMATNMLSHNLNEIGESIIETVKNPEITIPQILKIVKGPDFPGGGIIWFDNDLISAYETGRGKVKCRGEVSLDEKKRIIITSLPYGVNKSNFLENLVKKINSEIIDGISDIKDESNREGMRIVIKIKDEEMKSLIVNRLYMHTELEQSIGIINLVLEDNQPKQMNLKELITSYIRHRLNIILKRSIFDSEKLKEREHILEGLHIALSNIDQVIETIRRSKDGNEAKMQLIEKFTLSEKQAEAVLDTRLQRLTTLEVGKIEKELDETRKEIKRLGEIIDSEDKRKEILIGEVKEIMRKYGDARRTKVEFGELENIRDEDAIPREESVIILTEKGFLKRVTLDEYRSQKRGGKGVQTSVRSEDQVKTIVNCSSHDPVFFFTNTGKMYSMKAYGIESKSRKGVGVIGSAILKLGEGEKITDMMKGNEDSSGFLILATKRGFIKKTPFSEFQNVRANGIRAISLDEDDELSSVFFIDGERDIIVVSDSGKAARFKSEEMRPTGRASRGVKSMKIGDKEYILKAFPVQEGQDILTVSVRGIGKRTPEADFPIHHRGSSGVKIMKITERTGKVVAALPVSDGDGVIIMTKNEQTIRIEVDTVRELGRNSQGVKLIDVDDGDEVISAGKVTSGDDR